MTLQLLKGFQLGAQLERWTREHNFDIGTFGKKTSKSKSKSIQRGNAYHNRIYNKLRHWQIDACREQELVIEPWLRGEVTRRMLQPDFVLLDRFTRTAIVGEVKLNWKDGRDEKLIGSYLHAVKSAFGLEMVWPALVTSNVAHLNRSCRLGLNALLTVDDWEPGSPTPVLLVP